MKTKTTNRQPDFFFWNATVKQLLGFLLPLFNYKFGCHVGILSYESLKILL